MRDLRAEATQKLGQDFVSELDRVCGRLGIPSIWLLAIIESESQFNPKAINKANKDGTWDYGLIQFNGTHTLPQYGITGQRLIELTPIQQLAYIERYYTPTVGKVKSFGMLYLWNLSPAYFLNNPNHPTAQDFISKVEKAYTEKTGLRPSETQTASFSPLALPTFDNFKTLFKNPYFITGIVVILFLLFFNPFKRT